MRQWILSLAAVALIAGTTFAGKFNKALSVGDKAPAIAGVPAVAATGDKELALSLADTKEDVVVVAFLANHCPAVIAVEDRLFDLVKSYKGKSVKFVGVCCSSPDGYEKEDGIEAIKAKIKEGKYNMTYGYDADGKVGKAYGAVATPTFFVLDKDRNVRYTGKLDESADSAGAKAYVKTAVDSLLSNESIEVTETKAIGCGIPYKR